MKHTARLLATLGAVGAFTLTTPLSAQPKPRSQNQNQNVAFDDDLLSANQPGAHGNPLIGHARRRHAAQLIRPRASFVPELCASVEKL